MSSALARTEVLRVLLPAGSDAVAAGKQVLGLCELVRKYADRVRTSARATTSRGTPQ